MRVSGLGGSNRRNTRFAALALTAAAFGAAGCSPFDGSPLSAGEVELEEGGEAVSDVVTDAEDVVADSSSGDNSVGSVGQAQDGETGQAANGSGSADAESDGGAGSDSETDDAGSDDESSAGGGGAVGPEGNLGTVSLSSADNLMSTNPSSPLVGYGRLFVDQVVAAPSYEDAEPADGNVFIVADYQVFGIEYGNLFDTAFRANVNGTRYSVFNNINLLPDAGAIVNSVMVFEVPISALDETVTIEGGVIDPTADGYAAQYDVVFSGQPVPAPTEIAPELIESTGAVMQTSDGEALFTTNPAAPTVGVSSITVRNATSTLKIGPDAARPGFKFVQIDIETIGVATTGNLFEQAFRLQAEDEWYSPLGNINELTRPAAPFNTTLVFQVPRSAQWMVLEAGVPEEWAEGERTTFSIEFE